MRAVKKVLLWLLLVLVLAAVLAGGTVFVLYRTADAAPTDLPAVSFAGTALQPVRVQWTAPVLGGLLKKEYAAEGTAAELGVLDSAVLDFAVPDHYSGTMAVYRQGEAAPVWTSGGSARLVFDRNGAYTLKASCLKAKDPAAPGKGYGSFDYEARFTLDVDPAVSFSAVKALQGDVVAVLVTGIMDGSEPAIDAGELSLSTFMDTPGGKVAYIGLAYNREPGDYTVRVQCGELAVEQTITVVHRDFPRQDMTIDEDVAGETHDSAAANKEWRDAIWPTYWTAEPVRYWQGRFQWPTASHALNTEYGLFRYTNGSPTPERHGGIDIDAEEGDAVTAPAAGKVVYAGFLQLTGNTVVLDHGGGLKSYFFHMSALDCAAGDVLEAGAPVGKVGSTGYSTGAHLHYESKIGNQSIDPIQLFNGTSGLYFAE